MRLGQLARKLSIKTTEILSFIEEKEGPEISNHPNSKVPDEFVDDILEHFTPSPVEEIQKIIDSTDEAPKVEEVTESVEEIEEENIISKEDLKELAEVVAEKTASKAAEVISKTQDELAQEEEPITAAEDIEASVEVSDEVVADLAFDLANLAPGTMQFGLEAYVNQDAMDFDEALPYLGKKSAETFAGPDAQEGIAAFLEKREPKWD